MDGEMLVRSVGCAIVLALFLIIVWLLTIVWVEYGIVAMVLVAVAFSIAISIVLGSAKELGDE